MSKNAGFLDLNIAREPGLRPFREFCGEQEKGGF